MKQRGEKARRMKSNGSINGRAPEDEIPAGTLELDP